MRLRLLCALCAVPTITAVLCACGKLVEPTGEFVEPSSDSPIVDGGVNVLEPPANAPAEGSAGPGDGSVGPVDSSADGAPDAAEPACVEGDVAVTSASDGAALASITCIHGTLRIDTTSPISLPQLREVSGDVFIEQATGAVSFGALEQIGGRVAVGADAISTLSLPLLQSVAGTFFVESTSLVSIDAPQLASVGGLDISYTKTLHALSLPALKTVAGSVRFVSVDLSALSLPTLEACGELTVEDVALTTLQLPELKTVTGKIWVHGSPLLASVALPKLEEAESIWLDELPKLSSIDLTRVEKVTSELRVSRSPLLTQLSLPSLTSADTLDAYDLAKVATVSAPLLQGSATTVIIIDQMPSLTGVDLSGVTHLERLQLVAADRLTSFSLPAASDVTSVEIGNLSALTSIGFSALETVSFLQLSNLTKLVTVDVPRLHALSGGLAIQVAPKLANLGRLATVPTSLEFLQVQNTAIESLAFPNLVTADRLFVSTNQALTNISFPLLVRVSTADISYCPKLPSCNVDAMNAQLASGWIQWDDLAPCAP